MKVYIVLLVAVFCVASCARPKGKVLPKDKMVPVLVEIQLAEAEANNMNPLEGGKSLKVISEYDRIFTKYNIQPEDFYSSFEYYKSKPALMDSLYQDVLTELARQEGDLNNKINGVKKRKIDSTKAAQQKKPAGEP
jgi:hypothetical protein